MDEVVIQYFRKNFDLDLDDREMLSDWDNGLRCSNFTEHHDYYYDDDIDFSSISNKDLEKMAQKRTTQEFITELQPGEIFVFGSNLKGMHGGGAALVAYRKFGAVWGQGVGLQGQSYGIPTMLALLAGPTGAILLRRSLCVSTSCRSLTYTNGALALCYRALISESKVTTIFEFSKVFHGKMVISQQNVLFFPAVPFGLSVISYFCGSKILLWNS